MSKRKNPPLYRVLRGGGSVYFDSRSLRTADRDRVEPVVRFRDSGFRVVVVAKRRKP